MSVELYSNVELTEPLNGYPAGSHGNVVELLEAADGPYAMVEIFDDEGDTLSVEDIPLDQLKMVRDSADVPVS